MSSTAKKKRHFLKCIDTCDMCLSTSRSCVVSMSEALLGFDWTIKYRNDKVKYRVIILTVKVRKWGVHKPITFCVVPSHTTELFIAEFYLGICCLRYYHCVIAPCKRNASRQVWYLMSQLSRLTLTTCRICSIRSYL